MTLQDLIAREALSYHITVPDIHRSLRAAQSSFCSLDLHENDPFTIQKGKEGKPTPFPPLAVKLLFQVLGNLAAGYVPVMLPRNLEISTKDAEELMDLTSQDIQALLKEKKSLFLGDITDYKKFKIRQNFKLSGLREEEHSLLAEPQEILKVFNAHPNLIDLITDNLDPFIVSLQGVGSLQVAASIIEIVIKILSRITPDHTVMVFPLKYGISLEDAGFLLALPQDHVEDLLNQGIIAYHTTNGIRRIELSNLLAYKKIWDQKRQEGLEEIARLGQEIEELKTREQD